MKQNFLGEKNNKNLILYIFLISLSLAHVLFWISLIVSDGYAMNSIIFYYYTDSYMDFFNVQYAVLTGSPYDFYYAIYPPFAYLIYYFTTIFVQKYIFTYGPVYLMFSTEATYAFILFTIFTVVVLSIQIYNTKKGSTPIKIWFLLLIIFSTPFLFLYERGNILMLSLIFLFLFMKGYNSEKKWVRELSYVALAVSAAIKIYPAVFGLLILKEKRFKEAFHCIIYGLLLFILPSFAFGGPSIFTKLVSNISSHGGIAYRIDIFSGLDAISLSMGYGTIDNSLIKYGIWGILVILLIVCTFTSKSKWRTVLALTLLSITAPLFSYDYSLTFLVIPLIMFIDTDEKRAFIDYVYMILFIIILAPIAVNGLIINLPGDSGYDLYLYSYLCTISVIIMVFLLCIETAAKPLSKIELSNKKKINSSEEEQ